MAITPLIGSNPVFTNVHNSINREKNDISYGQISLSDSEKKNFSKENLLAFIGSLGGVLTVLGGMMKHQKVKNPFNLEYKVQHMLTMAGCADMGGILLSSAGKNSSEQKKKWEEGAFQFALTSTPLIFVDTILKQCSKASSKLINNNLTKIIASVAGVYTGSHLALWISNKLRNKKEAQKPNRELKPVDMIANLDDAVAIMVLAKIPFADKIQIKHLLPFIYSFCGYRSGTGNIRN